MLSMPGKSFLFPVLIFSCFFSPRNVSASFHPFYVSVTEMTYNAKTKSLEISCKMFAEDVEDVLEQNYKTIVDLGTDKQQSKNNNLVKDYANKHMSISIDGKPAAFKFIGFEKEKESIYCYLEVPNITALKNISVNNSILYDFKTEQINIIHFTVNGNRKSTKLDYPQSQANFQF